MTETTKTVSAAELIAKANAAKEAKAADSSEPSEAEAPAEVTLSATAYQLPIAPSTVWFKDKDGNKYKRIFPDGVAVPDTAEEKAVLEAMLKVGNCYRAVEGVKGAFQKTVPPVGSEQQ